jgi:hypothetical protein
MNDNRTRIGSQVDHDLRHYSFVRNSGIRREEFEAPSDRVGDITIAVLSAIVIVLVVAGVLA